jgi:hypothetical protein
MTIRLTGLILALLAATIAGPAWAADHRDLSGLWADGVVPDELYRTDGPGGVSPGAGLTFLAEEQDHELRERGSLNRPPYKPQFWNDVRLRDIFGGAGGEHSDLADPAGTGRLLGVPRMGPPSKIVQNGDFITLLYFENSVFRDIPIDCRPHNPGMAADIFFMGHAVGCWEDDALVITSKGFTDATWLDAPGQIHSPDMEVVETFRRDGDTLTYDVTVTDPVMFSRPWVLDTRVLTLDARPGAILPEDSFAIERALAR